MKLEWGIFLILPIILIYTALMIKKEGPQTKGEWKSFEFGPFLFCVPPWWTAKISDEENKKEFFRSDTYYDWKASFEEIPDISNRNLENLAFLKLESLQVIFDEDKTVSTLLDFPWNSKQRPISQHLEGLIRYEGTATQYGEKRIYLDIVFVKKKNQQSLFIFSSWSSVLSGLIEGPFFEETMGQMELLSSVRNKTSKL